MQIRQMKTMFSAESEIDQISVFIGTWNMGKFLEMLTIKFFSSPEPKALVELIV